MSSTITALTSGGGLAMAGDTSGQLELKTNNGTTAVTVTTAQLVGVGITSPTQALDVRTTTDYQLALGSTAGANYSIGRNTATGFLGFYGSQSGYTGYTFGGADGERMRIDSSGNLLVNTTGINASNLSGFVVRAYAGGIYTENGHNTSASSGDSYTIFRYNGTGIGSITQTGTTAVLYNTTSDYRLKTDVTPIQNALTTVEALNPVSFTWVDGRKDDGFLAHELQAIIPNCVTGEKDAVNEDSTPKYQQMDNSGVIPFLVKAIQELNAKVDAQAATITALQAKVGN